MLAKHIANIIMATAFISIFLGVFFFTYASKIEEKIVIERSTEIVQDLTTSLLLISPQQKQVLRSVVLPSLQVSSNLADQDKQVQIANKQLIRKAVIAISIFVFVCSILIGFLAYFFQIPLVELLKNNLLILCFVALTEFIFLTFFAQYYITIDSNFVKKQLADSLISFANAN
jgi:hypothetical protein